jgi:hypothetical protein
LSRSKLVRALLAIASLLGAVPLLGQTVSRSSTVTAAAPAPTFPYGRFVMQPPAGEQPNTAGLLVEFSDGVIEVYQGGQLVETDGLSVIGQHWQIWALAGGCAEPEPIVGNYKWSFQGGVLKFDLVEDACQGRAQTIGSIRMVRAPAP